VKGEQLAKGKVLHPGERQALIFRESIETATVERVFLCFAEHLAATPPGSLLVKHQVRSEAGPKSWDLGQSRSAGSKTHLPLAPAESDAAATQAINEVLTPEVLGSGGPEHVVLWGSEDHCLRVPVCLSIQLWFGPLTRAGFELSRQYRISPCHAPGGRVTVHCPPPPPAGAGEWLLQAAGQAFPYPHPKMLPFPALHEDPERSSWVAPLATVAGPSVALMPGQK